MDAEFDDAGNKAFRTLASYIFGANTSRQKLAMTAPVTQQRTVRGYTVAFVLPADVSLDTAPLPDDPRIRVIGKPAATTAVVTFSGRGGRAMFDEKLQDLTIALEKAAFTAVGEPRIARFDPPVTPGVFRHNEVQIDISADRGEKTAP